MRGGFVLLLVAVLTVCAVSTAWSATWTKIGSSGFVTSPALVMDRWRPIFNSIAVDASGNIYVTANNGNNRRLSGGITIFKTDGSVVNVDLNALGLQGGVTQLKTAGDGKVYGIQNWKQLWQWVYSGEFNARQYSPEGLPERILRFNPNGTVDVIFEVKPTGGLWQADFQSQSNTIVDLGGGNWGVLQQDLTAKYNEWWRYVADREQTIGARFRIEALTLTGTEQANLMQLSAKTDSLTSPHIVPASSPTPALSIKLIGGVPHFVLTKWNNMAVDILNLGPVQTGVWYEAYLYVNADPANPTVKLTFGPEGNVSEVYSASWLGDPNLRGGTGYAELGCATAQGPGGTNTQITWDWIGYGKGYQPSVDSLDNVCDCSYLPNDFNWGRLSSVNVCTTPYNGYADPDNDDYMHFLSGMDVGTDGNLYFTTSSFHRIDFFFRYNVATGEVERSPGGLDLRPTIECPGGNILDPNPLYGLPTINNGWNHVDGMFLLTWAGISPRDGLDVFSVGRTGGSAWGADPIQWNFQRDWGYMWNGSSWVNTVDAGWGRQTAPARTWDPQRNKLWLAPWSQNSSAYWNIYRLNQSGTWGVVDFPGETGNKGIRMAKTAPTTGSFSAYLYNYNYTDSVLGTIKQATLAARFVVTEFSGAYNCWFLMNCPAIPAGQYSGRPVIGIVDDNGTPKWAWGVQKDKNTFVQFGILGELELNVPHTCYLYAETTPAGVPRKVICNWDGVQHVQVLGDTDPGTSTSAAPLATSSWMNFGATGDDRLGGVPAVSQGTVTVVFDWVRLGRGDQTPGSTSSPVWDFNFDGSYGPHLLVRRTNVMSVFTGTFGNTCLWDIDPSKPYGDSTNNRVGSVAAYHMNGVDPNRLDHLRLYGANWWRGGTYWATGLAINPADGSAWMGWGADEYYTNPDLGHVIARDVAGNLYDEGMPEPGAQIAALHYHNGKMYALTCNRTTGVYTLYAADVPPTHGPQSIGQMKGDRVGSFVETDVPKVVTYVDTIGSESFFYIEDEDRTGGIRVSNPPTLPSVGDKVMVRGMLTAYDGEARIVNSEVTVISSGNPDVKPIGLTVRSVGGKQLGPQPATDPAYGLNNVGLLVRIAGKVTAIPTDDLWSGAVGFRNWFTVDDGSGAVTKYWDLSDTQRTVPGIKVFFDPGIAGVAEGDYVEVTGVVGLDFSYTFDTGSGAKTYFVPGQRIIFVRSAEDVHKYSN